MKLLAAIDFSGSSQHVMNQILRFPWPSGTDVCLLHVIDLPDVPNNSAVLGPLIHVRESLLQAEAGKLSGSGLHITTKVIEGHPRVAVADYAAQWDADLLFVGSRGTGGFQRLLLGSVAQASLRRAPCSVEIVRAPRASADGLSPMKVLLTTDGSESSMAAVKFAAERPWPAKSQLQVLSVVPLIAPLPEAVPMAPAYYVSPEIIDTVQREQHQRAEDAVARAKELLERVGLKPVPIECLPAGDPRPVILDQAKTWGADLIVMGSHGYHGVDRLMLGSVSEYVAMHAGCSVDVIRANGTHN